MITPDEAAQMIADDYQGRVVGTVAVGNPNDTALRIVKRSGQYVCIVTGSNSRWDWFRNMLTLPMSFSVVPGEKRRYAASAILGAQDVWGWLHANGTIVDGKFAPWIDLVTFYTGHSYGGTVSAIVGASANKFTITFAAYRAVLPDQTELRGDKVVTNYILADDWVTRVVPRYERNGVDVRLSAPWAWPWNAHNIRRYGEALG